MNCTKTIRKPTTGKLKLPKKFKVFLSKFGEKRKTGLDLNENNCKNKQFKFS